MNFPRSSDIAAELETEEAKLTAMDTFETRMRAMLREIVRFQAPGAGYDPDTILAGIDDAFSDAKSDDRVTVEHRIDELKEMLGFAEDREDRASYRRSVA